MRKGLAVISLITQQLVGCTNVAPVVTQSTKAQSQKEEAAVLELRKLTSGQLVMCINKQSNDPDLLFAACKARELKATECQNAVDTKIITANQHIPSCQKALNNPDSWDAPIQCLNKVKDPQTGEKALFQYEEDCSQELETHHQCLSGQIQKHNLQCTKQDVTKKLLIQVD